VILWFYYTGLFFVKIPDKSKIPEPYNNPEYCDKSIGCDFYVIGGGNFCGNMYYVNSTESAGIITDVICTCNITENKCITLSANK
jgi:hypothetical protein